MKIGKDMAAKFKRPQPRDLTPGQLEWLRANNPGFRKAEEAVLRSEENARRVAEQIKSAA